jgi:F0F1-type ATP synthase membrane subunit b/b'
MTDKLTDAQAARLAQLTIQQGATQIDTQRAALELQVRQWCVEQAVAVASATGGATHAAILASELFAFVHKPFEK